MEYLTVKWIHIISATIVFGTGLGSAWYWLMAHRQRNIAVRAEITKQVVKADWFFTTPAIVLLLISGAWMVDTAKYPLESGWIAVSLILFVIAAAAWIPVVGLQTAMRNELQRVLRGKKLSAHYSKCQRLWLVLGWIAFPATIVIFYLMVSKPWW